jgi:hypothetical protein
MIDFKNNNTDLYFLMRILLDKDVFPFDEIYFEKTKITFYHKKSQTKVYIYIKSTSKFTAKVRNRFFSFNDVKNYKDFINFIQLSNSEILNNYSLN